MKHIIATPTGTVEETMTKEEIKAHEEIQKRIQTDEKRAKIINELEDLDRQSIRAIRAGEQSRLTDLESQAVLLRKDLKKLEG